MSSVQAELSAHASNKKSARREDDSAASIDFDFGIFKKYSIVSHEQSFFYNSDYFSSYCN